MEQYNSIQQILKKGNGHDRKPIYPSTVIQAVFDAKTGASLEAILAQFNSIYVQYQGSPQATRNIIPVEMRRAGLMITYMNMDSETVTEKASSAVQKDNDHWGLDINWSRVDELSLSGDIAVSAQGTWIINGVDTKVPARGSKGDAGLTPWLKTIDNKLYYSYDNTTWEPCSDYLAGYFRFNATSSDSQAGTIGKIQISKDNKTWQDLSPEFRNYLRIQGYVSSTSALPKNQVVGTIYGVNEGTNTYSLHVWDGSTWVNNGTFTSIAAGVVQETGDSETEVMSQKAVSEKLSELGSEILYNSGTYNFEFTYTETPNLKVVAPFKKGDIIEINISEFKPIGSSGESNVALFNQYGNLITVFYQSEKKIVTLDNDTSFINIRPGIIGYTDIKVGGILSWGVKNQLKEFKESVYKNQQEVQDNIDELNKSQVGIEFIELSKTNNPRFYLKRDFKKGTYIDFEISEYTYQGSGDTNVAILNDSGNYLSVKYGNGKHQILLDKDTNYILFALGSVDSITNHSCKIKVIYDLSCRTNEVKKSVDELYDKKVNNVFLYQNDASKLNNWIYSSYGVKRYYGVKRQIDKSSYLRKIELSIFSDNVSYDGEDVDVLIATIDQRNWLLPIKTLHSTLNSIGENNYSVTIDNEYIPQFSVIFIAFKGLDNSFEATIPGVADETVSESDYIYSTDSLQSALTIYPFKFFNFRVEVEEITTPFVVKEEIESLYDKIDLVNNQISQKQDIIITDKITQEKYRILVANGKIIAKSIKYRNILYIGNSYSGFAWYDGRGMASSTPDTTYQEIIKAQIGGSYKIISGVGFERNSNGFNLDSWGLSDIYDCVVIQLGENGLESNTLIDDCERMFKYIINKCPSSDVYFMAAGNYNNNIRGAYIQAARNSGVVVCDVASVAMMDRYIEIGYYVLDGNGNYDVLTNTGITQGHPSDIGMYNIANSLLNTWGYNVITNRKYNISILDNNDRLKLVSPYWISKGVVNIKIIESITSIEVRTKSGNIVQAVCRENNYGNYYTFIMPEEDVTITID